MAIATIKSTTNISDWNGMAMKVDQLIDSANVPVNITSITGGAAQHVSATMTRSSGNVTAAGTVQGNATALASDVNWVTAADATKGVKLPLMTQGQVIYVKNDDAANAVLKVYCAASGNQTINAVAAASAFSMAAKTACVFVCQESGDTGRIFTIPLLAS